MEIGVSGPEKSFGPRNSGVPVFGGCFYIEQRIEKSGLNNLFGFQRIPVFRGSVFRGFTVDNDES